MIIFSSWRCVFCGQSHYISDKSKRIQMMQFNDICYLSMPSAVKIFWSMWDYVEGDTWAD